MPVIKDYSLVADSTTQSSPAQESDDLAHIRRAPRTYGRKREDPPVTDDPDTSFSSSQGFSSLGGSVHKTAPPGLADSVPPSSPILGTGYDTSASEGSSSSKKSGKYQFAWRKKLDEQSDDDEADFFKTGDAPKAPTFGSTTLLLDSEPTVETQRLQPNIEPRHGVMEHPLEVDNIFVTNFSSQPNSPSGSKAPSLSKPPQSRLKRKSRIVAHFDSGEDELTKGPATNSLSFSSEPSPRNANIFISTPNSQHQSPSTRPTSDEEELPTMAPKPIPKSKSRTNVKPLVMCDKLDNSLEKDKKAKAPTKKDKSEIVKERGRLAAQTEVEIPRSNVKELTTTGLIKRLLGLPNVPATSCQVEDDPIIPFSSPPPNKLAALPHEEDEDLPDVADLIAKHTVVLHKDLLEAKKRALAASKRHTEGDNDDDLLIQDMPIPVKAIITSMKKPRVSVTRKQQNGLAGVSTKKAAVNVSINASRATLEALLKTDPDHQTLNQITAIMAQQDALETKKQKLQEYEKHGGHLRSNAPENPKGLQSAVREFAEKGLRAAEARAPGRLEMGVDDEEDGDDEDWEPPLRGSESPEASDHGRDEMDVENDGSETYAKEDTPMDEDNAEEPIVIKTKTSRRVLIESDSEEEPNDENLPPRPAAHRNSSASESPGEDEDDKENNGGLVYDRDEDKENTAMTRRSAITGTPEDSVTNHRASTLSPDLPPRSWSARGGPEELPLSLNTRRVPFRDLTDESPFGSPVRPGQSFAAKLQQASPLASTLVPEPTLQPVFSIKGKEKAAEDGFSGFSQFSQSGEGSTRGLEFSGLTQQFAAAPLLEPGFIDLFNSPGASERSTLKKGRIAERPAGPLGTSYSLDLTQDIGLKPAFQHEVNISKLNKAQAIVEQDQEDILESALSKAQPKEAPVYVNDFGFLTQTRPSVGTPELYQPSPTQRSRPSRHHESFSSPSERQPLRTISLGSFGPDGYTAVPSPSASPCTSAGGHRRLRKRSSTSINDGEVEQKPPWDAFDTLMRGAKNKGKAKMKQRNDMDKKLAQEFFEDEAAESDDDNMFGIGIGRKQKRAMGDDDDEMPGEDLDATLEELVNDEQMDDETMAAQQVHEKYKEQLELDDQAAQKNVEEVVRGEKRKRTRKGLGIDDSDESDEEDDANKRARRRMMRGTIKERGDIRDLETNYATRAFAETYNQSLRDDDDEFGYLKQESQLDDLLPSTAPRNDVLMDGPDEDSDSGIRQRLVKRPDEDDDDDFYVDENAPPADGPVSVHQLRKEIQERARMGLLPEDTAQNMDDVSWIDEQEERKDKTGMLKVKRVSALKRPAAVPKKSLSLLGTDSLEDIELDAGLGPAFHKSVAPGAEISKAGKRWLTTESSKVRMGGTSRSVGGSAITGHAKSTAKGGKASAPAFNGGPTRKGFLAPGGGGASNSVKDNRLKSAPSMLSAITDKSRNFGPS